MKVRKILISQPEPVDFENSPYRNLKVNHNVELTFFKFFDIVGISASEFRKTRIHFAEYTAVIFNSKNSVDHFFRMAKELRESVPEKMKYFCSTEAIALYMQNYIQYRKRKIFFGTQQYFADLLEVMSKHREEKFLFPCSDEKQTEYTKLLDKAKYKYTKAPLYRAVPKDMKHINLEDFDMVAVFSPIGVRALLQNYPDIKDKSIMIAAFGSSTHAALNAAGIKLTVAAPTKSSPSMAMAIENFILGKQQDPVISSKPSSTKAMRGRAGVSSMSAKGNGVKKTKSVFTSKAKYRQLMEEKKARSAAKRAARAAEKARKEAERLAALGQEGVAASPTETNTQA